MKSKNKKYQGIETWLFTTFSLLNIVFPTLAGIWLAFLGEWKMIIFGIIFIGLSHYLISFILLAGSIFDIPSIKFLEKGKKGIGLLFGILGDFYQSAVIIICSLYILEKITHGAEGISLIPVLLWSYGIIISPWISLTQHDLKTTGDTGGVITVVLIEISYIFAIIMFYLNVNFLYIIITFSFIVLVGGVIHKVKELLRYNNNIT